MVFTEQQVRENLRVKDGKRVFYLAAGDLLTPSARQWLRQEHIDVLPAAQARVEQYTTLLGGTMTEKPEHMTHLRGNILVAKDHPRIRFRGMIDTLEADILLTIRAAKDAKQQEMSAQLTEVLAFVRSLIPADVLQEPVKTERLCGMTMQELRERSHFPQKFYGQPHFMPTGDESSLLLLLNKARTTARQTELAAFAAFYAQDDGPCREDILTALNRLSSLFWIFMIREKAREGTQ